MFKNVFISISAAALLFTGLASNVNVSAQTLVADADHDVVVEDSCSNMAIKYPKQVSIFNQTLPATLYPVDLTTYDNNMYESDMLSGEYTKYLSAESVTGLNFVFPPETLGFGGSPYYIYSCYNGEYTAQAFDQSFEYQVTYDGNTEIYNFFDSWLDPQLVGQYITLSKTDFCAEVGILTESCNLINNHQKVVTPGPDGDSYQYFFTYNGKSHLIDTNVNYSETLVQHQLNSISNSTPTKDIKVYCYDFWDVPENYQFASFICSLKNDSIIGGYPDGTYKPTRNVTRGEMAVFIKRAFGVETNTSCGDFSDMSSTTPFYEEAMSLKCAGIIGGSPDGKGGKQYLWNNEVSRGEMSVFIKNAANNSTEKIPTDTSCENFNDMNASTPFYTEATSLKCKSIIGGYPNSNGGRDYRPLNKVNRGELSVFIDNSRKL